MLEGTRVRNSLLKPFPLYLNVFLAVYPYKITFNQDIDTKIVLYFEKGNQILGINEGKPICFGPQKRGTTLAIKDPKWIVHFRFYSSQHVHPYKWSLYRATPDLTFYQHSQVHFEELSRQISQMKPQSNIVTSQLENEVFQHKEYICQFLKSGIILNFALFVTTRVEDIVIEIQKVYFTSTQHHYNSQSNASVELLKVLSIDGDFPLPPQQNNQNMIKNSKINSDLPKHHTSSLDSVSLLSDYSLKAKSISTPKGSLNAENIKKQTVLKKKESIKNNFIGLESSNSPKLNKRQTNKQVQNVYDLDFLILNQDSKQKISDQPELHVLSPKEEQDDDLVFGVEQPRQNPSTNNTEKQQIINQSKKIRDYSLLNLESDAIKKEPIDIKLQIEQLQAIEEDINSVRSSTQMKMPQRFVTSPKSKETLNKPLSLGSNQTNKSQQIEIQSTFLPKSINFKQIMVIFILAVVLFMFGVSLNSDKKKRRLKRRVQNI